MILGIALLCLGLFLSSPQIGSLSGSVGGREAQKVDLPWIFYEVQKGNVLKMDVYVYPFSPRVWQIIPDDYLRAITVNGQSVSLADIPESALRDYGRGFKLDFSDYFVKGNNSVEFLFDNGWGPGGLDIRPMKGWLSNGILFLGFVLILASLCSVFGLRRGVFALLCFVLVVILAYWQETNWVTRTHDVGGDSGHYGYVKYIAERVALPKPNEGWVFYHPPAYYIVGAVIFKLADLLHFPPTEALQALAIVFWLVFLTSSIATFQFLLPSRRAVFWGAAISLALWPSGIIRSVGLGNDIPLYACFGLIAWFMCRWWKSGDRVSFWWMSVLSALAILIKSNGVVAVAAVGTLLLVRFFLRKGHKKCKAFMDGVIFGFVVLVGVAASFAVRIFYYMKGELSNWLVSNAGGLGDSLRVPVSVKAFIPLDIPTFITEPFVNSYLDSTGRANFWNFLMRSSLSGEFSFDGAVQKYIAYGWGVALVLLFLASLFSIPKLFHMRWQYIYRQMPIIVLIVSWLLSMIAFRIMLPFACSNDFRYITPILMPLLLVWALMGKTQRMGLVFISATSTVFFLIL